MQKGTIRRMKNTAPSEKSVTPRHQSGFKDRLDEALKIAGIDGRGKVATVAHMAGMTHGGVRLLYANDRPPKQYHTFDRLVEELCSSIAAATNQAIDHEALSHYLLYGHKNPFYPAAERGETSPAVHSAENSDLDIYNCLREDPIYTSQLILLIDQLARDMAVEFVSPDAKQRLHLIHARIARYCAKNKPDIHAEKLKEMIESMLRLEKEGLL